MRLLCPIGGCKCCVPFSPFVPFSPLFLLPVGGVCQWRTDFARPVILIVRHTDVRMYSFEELTEYDSVAP